jgi:NADH:ubiquinone oxidoreductase subunit 6 (subunit J)
LSETVFFHWIDAMLELFLVVAVIAIASALLMLVSENAVHSALFLIVTMAAIAFLFLMLNAPFLAMIQITVYAGAIMVLFLFVIMLLGAERSETSQLFSSSASPRRFRWFLPAALTLGLSLFFVIGLAILNEQVDAREIPEPAPQARVLHASPVIGVVDVYAGDALVAEGLEFSQATDFVTLAAGENAIRLVTQAGEELSATLTFENATTSTIIARGTDAPTLSVIPTDLTSIPTARTGRYTVFNGTTTALALVDVGTEFDANDNYVILSEVAPDTQSQAVLIEDEPVNLWLVDAADPESVVVRMEDYEIAPEDTTLIYVGEETQFDGTTRIVAVPIAHEARPAFGGPRAIGYQLFTTYMLPFQLLALLLLAAMVGAIVLTHRETVKSRARVGERRRVSRPLTQVIAAQVGQESVSADAPQLPSSSSSPATGD